MVCLSRPLLLVSPISLLSSVACVVGFSIFHKHGPLQTPRFQTLDDGLDWFVRKSFLYDCGLEMCSLSPVAASCAGVKKR